MGEPGGGEERGLWPRVRVNEEAAREEGPGWEWPMGRLALLKVQDGQSGPVGAQRKEVAWEGFLEVGVLEYEYA